MAEDLSLRNPNGPEALPMYKVCETVRANHGPDGAVVLDIQRGRVLRFNVTGSFIFECLQRGEPESIIIDGMSQRFDVSRAVAEADVNEFLNSMEREGLIWSASSMVHQ
jgi:hypothetical protein